jgi:hypothetical protein
MWRIVLVKGAEPLTKDYGDGLEAKDCVGEDVQQ